ncbi:MAG: hypothetical protein IPP97_00070 [Candidatus Obscuribacter sp.]|nr:hypothetical protein [Candidatus Obscuribacter sp.]MBP6349512.1 hypothetical protein [Candidatus Obscuribacter sp.]MBP6591970.1 hypothetical protein [Candidatus Obscuribacter sp.]MBP7578415.1 hypothetical protein [Candidatus Obscuribacter sp.]
MKFNLILILCLLATSAPAHSQVPYPIDTRQLVTQSDSNHQSAEILSVYEYSFCEGYTSTLRALNLSQWLPISEVSEEEWNKIALKDRETALYLVTKSAQIYTDKPGLTAENKKQLKSASGQGFVDGEAACKEEAKKPFYRVKGYLKSMRMLPHTMVPHFMAATYRYGEKLNMSIYDIQAEIARFNVTSFVEKLKDEPLFSSKDR